MKGTLQKYPPQRNTILHVVVLNKQNQNANRKMGKGH